MGCSHCEMLSEQQDQEESKWQKVNIAAPHLRDQTCPRAHHVMPSFRRLTFPSNDRGFQLKCSTLTTVFYAMMVSMEYVLLLPMWACM